MIIGYIFPDESHPDLVDAESPADPGVFAQITQSVAQRLLQQAAIQLFFRRYPLAEQWRQATSREASRRWATLEPVVVTVLTPFGDDEVPLGSYAGDAYIFD